MASQGMGSQGTQSQLGKKTLHLSKITVEKLLESYYLIAYEVFIIDDKPRKLTSEEIQDLPVNISWSGPQYDFDTDEKTCFKLLTEIIFDMNIMQNPKFSSFPLGMFQLI